ncbi:hypothetical protein ACFUT3_30410 [Streptomyces cinereoruber]|uniref:hypothetical protein n=1 Tax=Streptomyces cinereoruber TaxID=67260 RepID=UPI00363569A0
MKPMQERCAPWRGLLKPQAYASIVPGRAPELKFHGNIGRAKSAVAYRTWGRAARGGEIHRLVGDAWELVYRVEEGTPLDALPWKTDG